MKNLLRSLTLSYLLILFLFSFGLAEIPAPPPQPLIGPGGNNYKHANVIVDGPYWPDVLQKSKNYKYYFYRPAEPSPDEAPVILFLHGWGAISPTQYDIWLRHIARQGYIVVFVQYQRDNISAAPKLSLFPAYEKKVILMWRDALKRLDAGKLPVRPEKDATGVIKTAIVGHSTGGLLSMLVAADAINIFNMIPVPRAVVAVEPGDIRLEPMGPFKSIDSSTKVVIVVGDEDDVVCKLSAVTLWNRISYIPDENKDFLLVLSDYHGFPKLIANHFFPTTSGYKDESAVDARDFYVTFKLSVGAFNCAFRGTDCEYAFGHGSQEQMYMGQWSDGQPVQPMVWIADPNSMETTCQDVSLFGQ